MSYALPPVTYLMNETALNVLLALTFQLTSIERPFNASSRIAGASYGHHHGETDRRKSPHQDPRLHRRRFSPLAGAGALARHISESDIRTKYSAGIAPRAGPAT